MTSSEARVGLAALLAIALLAPAHPAAAQAGVDSDYRLGPNDEVRITVLEDEALNVDRSLSATGALTLPLLGVIEVGGLTTEEAGRRIQRELERDYLRQATVDLVVTAARSRPITVLGAVVNPGTVFASGDWRLSEAIAAAGGLGPSSRGVAEVRRESANGLSDQITIDLSTLTQHGDRSKDLPVFPRDVINVLVAEDITVYFLGEVSTQGAVTISGRERATLLTAIARAGGLTDRAASRLVVRRPREGAEPLEIIANFRRILAGTDPDIELQDGDLIVVKEAFL